ncbi:MAG: DUF1015 domain-containing protein [Myxococcales bacterium]|nr:DUF1015 domain-containing protein [Myxococcales bacterium]
MVDVAPLAPLVYSPELLPAVVAPPYDVIDAELRETLAVRHPENVVHLDLPSGEGAAKYAEARRLLADWQSRGVLQRDRQPAFWRYAQTFEPPGGGARLTRSGFFALVRVQSYADRVILPHERTLTGPKLDRLELGRATRAAISPGFMLYSDPERTLDGYLDDGDPFADFTTDDGVRHQLSRVSKATSVVRIASALADARLLIADGHHRYETALTLSSEIDAEARAAGGRIPERAEHHYFPVLLANGDDPSLVVFPTHRLLHSLASADFGTLLVRAEQLFAITPASGGVDDLAAALEHAPEASLCVVAPDGRAALLVARAGVDLESHPVLGKRPAVLRETAVTLLHDGLLEHVLGISPEAQAQKTNIRYVQSARDGIAGLNQGGQLLFLMKPTPVRVVRSVAEAGEVMPQKSTFFYPKVPTGLFFHTLDPERDVS